MFTLILENFRCFDGRHEVPVKPLTLLTGENSAGKSTLLAAIACVVHPMYPISPTFNEHPYYPGNYKTIATNKGGRYGVADYFRLGYRVGNEPLSSYELLATYRNSDGVPDLTIKFDRATVIDYIKDNIDWISPDTTKPLTYMLTLTVTGLCDDVRFEGRDIIRCLYFLKGQPTPT